MRATIESAISYLRYRVRNGDALKRFAATKGSISYARYRVRNGDALKRFTRPKSSISYACYRVRNSDALKRIAIAVFANAFISVTYVLNGRKVTAKILKRLEKMKI